MIKRMCLTLLFMLLSFVDWDSFVFRKCSPRPYGTQTKTQMLNAASHSATSSGPQHFDFSKICFWHAYHVVLLNVDNITTILRTLLLSL